MKQLLLLDKLKITNANSLSSYCTAGFPAITAFGGFVRALERCLQLKFNIQLTGFAVISHKYNAHKEKNKFFGSRKSPLTRQDRQLIKNGGMTNKASIPEATCDLDVSILIEHTGDESISTEMSAYIRRVIRTMRIAGGKIDGFHEISNKDLSVPVLSRMLRKQLMPGYFIKCRRKLIAARMKQGYDAIESLYNYLAIKDGHKARPGWFCPIATGFHLLTKPSKTANQRDPGLPHVFAESLVSLGEFVMIHKAVNFNDMMWRPHYDANNKLFYYQQTSRSSK